MNKFTTLFLAFLVLVVVVFPASAPPTWTGTSKIQSGMKIIVQSNVHQESNNYYIYTYSPAFTTDPYTALGVIGLETFNLHEEVIKFLINIQNYTSQTELKIKMVMPTDTHWQHFRVSYIAVDKDFTMVQVDYFQTNNPVNVGTGLGERTFSGSQTLNIGSLNLNHEISVLPFLVGLDMSSINGQHSIFWETSLRDANSINYKLTVKRTTRVFSITSYILIIDRSLIAFDQQKYLDEVYSTGSYNHPSHEKPVFHDIANIHAGINSFSFQLTSFDLDKDTLTLTTGGYYNQINITLWSYRERTCPDPTMPYYEENTNLCYDQCPSGYVQTDGTSKKYCQACYHHLFGCKLCSPDGSTCIYAYGNYQIVQPDNTTVICPNGFYQSYLNEHIHPMDRCRACHFSCQACYGPSQYDCYNCTRFRTRQLNHSCPCDYGEKLNGQCLGPCDDPGCQKCDADSAICEECFESFTLAGSRCICGPRQYYEQNQIVCLPCHSSCYYCSGPGSNQCNSCDRPNDKRYFSNGQCLCSSNYADVFGICEVRIRTSCEEEGYELDPELQQCVQSCGEGISVDQQCDDGNVKNEDGCSQTCEIEQGYICADNSLAPTRRSYCSYQGPLKLELLETTKQIYSNRLNLTFKIEPQLHHVFKIYTDLTSNATFEPSQYKVTTKNFTYDAETKIFHSQVEYDENIHGKKLKMTFQPPKTAQTFAVSVSSYEFYIKPENNLAAMSYDDSIYIGVDVGKAISMAITIIALILATALLFYRKMMGLQLITMIQLVYLGSLLTEYSHPFMAPVHQLHYSHGFNGIKFGEDENLAQPPYKTLEYHTYFYMNYNFMLILSLVVYLIALALFIGSQLTEKSKQRKLKEVSQFFITEVGFGLMVFSLNNIVASIFISVKSGTMSQFDDIWDKIFFICAGIIIIAQIAYFFYVIHNLTDSQFYYHRSKNYTHYYPLALIIKNILITIFIFLKPELNQVAPIICVAISGVYILVVLAGRPFRKFIDYFRFGSVQITLLFFLVYKMVWDQNVKDITTLYNDPLDYFFMVSCYVVIGGMFAAISFTIASFIYHLYISCKKSKEVNPEPFEEDEAMSKKEPYKKFYGEQSQMGKSKQFMVVDYDQDYLRKTPPISKYNKSSESNGNYGLIPQPSSETGISDQQSRRRLRRNKKRKFEYQ